MKPTQNKEVKMTLKQKKTCADVVQESYLSVFDDWLLAELFCGEDKDLLLAQGYKAKTFNDYIEYENIFDYVNQTALSWDFVEAGTFTDQTVGYFRLQLSYGGPSTEFRIYTDKQFNIDRAEYWHLDWSDGASVIVKDQIVLSILDSFLEVARCSHE
tara:strand:+ start:206 stop:676 length:471 start_codon:yes stop_codon:yes gene_type:complete